MTGLTGVFNFAMRNLARQRIRTGLTLAALALGVASIILSGGFVEDILIQLRESTIHSQLGHLQVYRVGAYANATHHPFDYLIEDARPIDAAIGTLGGVETRASRLAFSGLVSNGRGDLPVLAEGIEPAREAQIGSAITLLEGRQLKPEDTAGILMGEGLARGLGSKPGDHVDLVVNTREGAMNTLGFQVVGIFRTLSREYDARAVRLPLPAAQELTEAGGVSLIVVLLAETDDTLRAQRDLAKRLPPGYEVKRWDEVAAFYTSTAALYERQFGVLQIIIVVMVVLGVANSVAMTLHERTPEFGILRALGRRGRDVFQLAVLEAGLLGVVGSSIGVVAGALLAVVISAIGIPMPPPPNSESPFTATIRIVPFVLAAAFWLGVLASVAASILPARKLARLPVVEALRRSI